MIDRKYKELVPLKMSELCEEGQIAMRAHQRAARKLRAENKRLGLPLIIWENGKMIRKKL